MERFRRVKRVTDPLNDEEVRARIVGFVSSATTEDDGVAESLSEIFYGTVDGDRREEREEENGSDCEIDSSTWKLNLRNLEVVLFDRRDEFKEILKSDVVEAVARVSCTDGKILRRTVVADLRDLGYNAAVCETRWENSGRITAGSYEFIDVIRENEESRYFVDLNFSSEFKIARPTCSYERMLHILPTIFVGVHDELKQILAAMSDGARRSLQSRSLYRPPWRKLPFLQNKWLGPYRRTAESYATSIASPPSINRDSDVKCRALGFNVAAHGGRLFIPAATISR